MFISWYLIGSSFILNCVFAFLCECVCMRVAICARSLSHRMCAADLSLGQALDILLAGKTVCGFSSWSCCSGGRKRCMPPKPPATPPPSSAERPAPCSPCSPFPGPQSLGCGLWMSATSWLSAKGLAGDWPVVEVQYQALSVSSSFHFLPPINAGYSQWHTHTACRAVTDSHLWLENERITLRIGIFIAMPTKRGCLKPLSARVLCF